MDTQLPDRQIRSSAHSERRIPGLTSYSQQLACTSEADKPSRKGEPSIQGRVELGIPSHSTDDRTLLGLEDAVLDRSSPTEAGLPGPSRTRLNEVHLAANQDGPQITLLTNHRAQQCRAKPHRYTPYCSDQERHVTCSLCRCWTVRTSCPCSKRETEWKHGGQD